MAGFTVARKRCEKYMTKMQAKQKDFVVFDDDLPDDCKFSFIDFTSECRWIPDPDSGTYYKKFSWVGLCLNDVFCIELKTFLFHKREVVSFSNEWIAKNAYWEIVGCETVNSNLRDKFDSDKMNPKERTPTTSSAISRASIAAFKVQSFQSSVILTFFCIIIFIRTIKLHFCAHIIICIHFIYF